MRIAAVMVVRNERAILPYTLGHLINGLGVDQVLVADNGSTDGTPAMLQRLASADRRIRWTDEPGPFDQAGITTGLAAEMGRAGAAWVLPTDADEFLWLRTPGWRFLDEARGVGAWAMQVRNFVQWTRVRKEDPGTVERMVFSARPVGIAGEAMHLVQSGRIAFLQNRYPQKLILRATPDLKIHKGNHGADGVIGTVEVLKGGRMLHAPLRAQDALAARIDKARRIYRPGDPTFSWHLQRLLIVDADDEWRANSTRFGEIGPAGRKRPLRFDLRLRNIARRQRSFARQLLDA